jgi:hypothetical protein
MGVRSQQKLTWLKDLKTCVRVFMRAMPMGRASGLNVVVALKSGMGATVQRGRGKIN